MIDFNIAIAAKKASNKPKMLRCLQCDKGYISQPMAIPTAKNLMKQAAAYFTRSDAVLFVNPASAIETSKANKHIAEKWEICPEPLLAMMTSGQIAITSFSGPARFRMRQIR
jgi:hypothetical protein